MHGIVLNIEKAYDIMCHYCLFQIEISKTNSPKSLIIKGVNKR